MKKKALGVTLQVHEPSTVELTVGDKVQLDRLVARGHGQGHVAERCGDLLVPGTTTLVLDQGFYFFKTLSDANLKVVRGGVEATTSGKGGKDLPPPLQNGDPPQPEARGDDVAGEAPSLTVA